MIKKRILIYLSVMVPVYCLITYLINLTVDLPPPESAGSLIQKTNYYKNNSSKYNLLFVGDSRTYCGMDPDIFNDSLQLNSYNLAHWANWFPTQYPQYQEIISAIPKETIVVWTIGHQNFLHATETSDLMINFPIGTKNLPDYLRWGYTFSSMQNNLANHANSGLSFLYPNQSILRSFRSKMNQTLKEFNSTKEPSSGNLNKERRSAALQSGGMYDSILNQYEGLESIKNVEPLFSSQYDITSAVLRKRNGNYTRIEIDHDFFRKEQRDYAEKVNSEWAEKQRDGSFIPEERYLKNFEAILKLFKSHGIQLIVNEIEEAPNGFGNSEEIKNYYLSFMANRVKPYVEEMGFRYIKADFSILDDEDYFDYNHLNDRGILKYDSMMVNLLRPLIKSSNAFQ